MIQRSVKVKRIARFLRPERVILILVLMVRPVAADPVQLQQWPQPVDGTPVYITYSYSNLLDGTFLLASPAELRSATEEALRLWARYAPLHFTEQPDSGPAPSDSEYAASGNPQIRIGHHVIQDLAHAYFPGDSGLAGDVHVASGIPWSIGEGHWNFLETITHELGHSLGLMHESVEPAIMNASYPSHRFQGLGTAYLYPADIRQLQAIYGRGSGSVQTLDPAPEPATWVLLSGGLAALARTRRQKRSRWHQ